MISIEFEYKHAADTQLLFRHEMKWGITYPILTDIVRGLYNGAASVKIKDDSSFLDETVFHAFPGVASSDEDPRARLSAFLRPLHAAHTAPLHTDT